MTVHLFYLEGTPKCLDIFMRNYTKVVVNVANHLEKAFMMVHDEECERIYPPKSNAKKCPPLSVAFFCDVPPPLDQKLKIAKAPQNH